MAHRWIEIVIGKLVTDAELRHRFVEAPHDTLSELVDRGVHLTASEVAALLATDFTLWERTARQIGLLAMTINPKSERGTL